MKHTSIISMKYPLTALAITLFLLLSCGVAESTSPSGTSPGVTTSKYMSFTISDSGGASVTPSTALLEDKDYVVTVKRENDAPLRTADYTINVTPPGAITINNTRSSSNKIEFIVKDANAGPITITAIHKNNPIISNALELNLAPPEGFMSFTLSDNGDALSTSTKLARAKNYVVTVKRGSSASLRTADYNFVANPTDAITINTARSSSNKIDFTVNNTAATSVTITATHKAESSITATLELSLAPPASFMSFTLSDRDGASVAPSTQLSRGGTYGLVINRENDAPLTTENYNITVTPAEAITINNTRPNSIAFTVNNTAAERVTITATHKDNPVITKTLTLNLRERSTALTPFATDIQGDTVPNLASANALTREVLTPLGVPEGTPLVKRYATESGGGTKDGSGWTNAWAATDLRNNINAISDAAANKVYLIMIAGGTYKPTSGNDRTISFSMKNYVAIMGGFKAGGGWERTGITLLSGDIGSSGNSDDNSYHVFFHNSISLANSHLYGVTITNGNANGSGTQGFGGGMHNDGSSPNLTRVVFSGNSALYGGGMYNLLSSLVLNNTVFSGNNAQRYGGGMVNNNNASPVISNTIFSRNSAEDGGGMYNSTASPVIVGAVFSENTATKNGGGMFSSLSSPVLVGTVFSRNSGLNGGGMWNDNNGAAGPLIVNTIFSGNTVTGGGGPDIGISRDGSAVEYIRIAGSVLGIGLANPTDGIVHGGPAPININYHHLKNGAVNFGADATTGGLTYPTIGAGSSAINLGVFVRRSGTTYYFSEDNSTWYTGFSATGGWGSSGTLPANAEDLTARDITGKARTGRPDAGVFELP